MYMTPGLGQPSDASLHSIACVLFTVMESLGALTRWAKSALACAMSWTRVGSVTAVPLLGAGLDSDVWDANGVCAEVGKGVGAGDSVSAVVGARVCVGGGGGAIQPINVPIRTRKERFLTAFEMTNDRVTLYTPHAGLILR